MVKKKAQKKPVPKLEQLPKRSTPRTKLSSAALKQFTKVLLVHKKSIQGKFIQMEDEALGKSRRDAAGDLSTIPLHTADQGTDTYEQDLTINLMQGENSELEEIKDALDRIADKTYGVCERCGKMISLARLKVIPYARLCIGCREEEEKSTKY